MKLPPPVKNKGGQKMGLKGLSIRRRIVLATTELLQNAPMHDLTITYITKLAAISVPTFYIYFDGIIDAVLAATEELPQSIPKIMAVVRTPWHRETSQLQAINFVEAYVVFWDKHRSLLRARILAAEEGDIRFTLLREKAVLPLLRAMGRQIERAQAEKRRSQKISARANVAILLMMLEQLGALAHTFEGRELVTFDAMCRAAAHRVADTFGWSLIDD